MDSGARNLVLLVAAVWSCLFSFYGFLAYRARLWSPLWAISATEKVFAAPAGMTPPGEGPAIARGRRLFREFRCGVCHGPNGEGGVKNPNADLDGVVPNLFDLADAFTRNDLKDKIRKGSQPAKIEEGEPEPVLDMPAWAELLSEDKIEDLSQYLFSLKSPPESKNKGEAMEAGGT